MTKLEKAKKAMLSMQRYSWEQGVASQAMLESGEAEWTILLAREAVHRSVEDGRVAIMGNFPGITDPCSNGEPIGFARDTSGEKIFDDKFKKLLEWAMVRAPRNSEGVIYHQESAPEFWVDSFYMLPPFLAYAGKYREAIKQINGWWKALFDVDKKLLSHMWEDDKKIFTRKAFWGVGNGWAMAGMARVVFLLPEKHFAEKQILIERIKTLISSSLVLQRPDSLFHDVLDDKESFVETNFAQMLAYTIYRGILDNWIEKDDQGLEWLEKANAIRSAVNGKVDGFGYVHGVCGAPDFSHHGFAVEGQAFYILMEAMANKLGFTSSDV